MGKKCKIILLVLLVIALCVAGFVWKQWDNINAVVDAIRYSNEEVEKKLEENTKAVQQYLQEEENITVREITEEESKALSDGSMTEEEVISRMTGQPTAKETPTPASKSSAQLVSEAVAKLYITKNDYLGRLDSIEASVLAQYSAMSAEDKKGAKQRFLAQYLPMVSSWESECDAAVYSVIDELRLVLKDNGQGTAMADQLESAYLNEKRLKKSYFINRYMD